MKDLESAEVNMEDLKGEEEPTEVPCEKCSSPMVLKRGRFGNFLACSQYPECKITKPLKLGVKCPSKDCGGDLVQKRTKKGKNFYSCSKYPTCTFAIWDKPINRTCPQCQSPFLVEKYKKQTGTQVVCHDKECEYEEAEGEKEKVTSQPQTSPASDAQKL